MIYQLTLYVVTMDMIEVTFEVYYRQCVQ